MWLDGFSFYTCDGNARECWGFIVRLEQCSSVIAILGLCDSMVALE